MVSKEPIDDPAGSGPSAEDDAKVSGFERTVLSDPGAGADAGAAPRMVLPDLGERFDVIDFIGGGGMGIVVRARHRELERDVAVKLISKNLVLSNPVFLERFRREARVAARLDHPNIIKVFDLNTAPDGTPYIEMELLDGEDLAHFMRRRGPIGLEETVRILRGVADALDTVHAEGIFHRDLKPGNIMYTKARVPKILDFGITHLVVEGGQLTATNDVVGTPAYMAPEQMTGGEVTAACDIYALGTIAFEMLSGRLPIPINTLADISRKLYEDPPSIQTLVPGLRRDAADALSKALHRRPEDRYGSATELIEALDRCVEHGDETPGDGATTAAIRRRAAGGARRRKGILAALGAVALMAAAAAAFVLTRSGEEGPAGSAPPMIQRPRIAIFPFRAQPQRDIDARTWPLADRMLINRLAAADLHARRLARLDPMAVEREMRRREIERAPGRAEAVEIGRALDADLLLFGEVGRAGGMVTAAATVALPDGTALHELRASGTDVFEAMGDLAGRVEALFEPGEAPAVAEGSTSDRSLLRAILGGAGGAAASAPAASAPAASAWIAILQEPWETEPYLEFVRATEGAADVHLAAFAREISGDAARENPCRKEAEVLAARYPEAMGPLAKAVCAFKRLEYAESFALGEEAFREMALRRWAGAFLRKVGGQVRDRSELVTFMEEYVSLFPEDAAQWSFLAMLQGAQGKKDEAAGAMRVAEALYREESKDLSVPLDGARMAIRDLDLPGAKRWLDRLRRAPARTEFDVLYVATLRATVAHMQGRVQDSWEALDAARVKLAKHPGEAYTVAAITLFYSYLQYGAREEAAAVAEEYSSLFRSVDSPDHWIGGILELAAKRKPGESEDAATTGEEVARLGAGLERSVPEGGARLRDAQLCLFHSHAGMDDAAREIARQADPSNTMIAGCRLRAAQALARQERTDEAREMFGRVRADILWRSNFYVEFLLPALLGEAAMAERLGDREAAARGYGVIAQSYKDADRELAEVAEAKAGLERLQDR